jgi:hypothetical protein
MQLHRGKLIKTIETTVTDEFAEALADRARETNCKTSDLIREGMYLLLTGASYSVHVANDRARAFVTPANPVPETSGNDGEVQV